MKGDIAHEITTVMGGIGSRGQLPTLTVGSGDAQIVLTAVNDLLSDLSFAIHEAVSGTHALSVTAATHATYVTLEMADDVTVPITAEDLVDALNGDGAFSALMTASIGPDGDGTGEFSAAVIAADLVPEWNGAACSHAGYKEVLCELILGAFATDATLTVKIQHSTDGSDWHDLTDATFGELDAASANSKLTGVLRVNTENIYEYLRFNVVLADGDWVEYCAQFIMIGNQYTESTSHTFEI